MASAGRVQTLLTCAKAQERHAMLPDGFSVGHFRLGTRLRIGMITVSASHALEFLLKIKLADLLSLLP